MDQLMLNNPWKYRLAMITNGERRKGGPEEAFRGGQMSLCQLRSRGGQGRSRRSG